MRIKNLGVQDYLYIWEKMQQFTQTRGMNTADELWIVEHDSVFTQGISDTTQHTGKIPVIKTDRGGKITYHGRGQLIIYCLIDLKRLGIGIKKMVSIIEQSIMELLAQYQIKSQLKTNAPGVYVADAKIAALGLKVKKFRTYHGLSLNVDMDLSPFEQINPCGYPGLKVTQMRDLTDNVALAIIAKQLSTILKNNVTRN